MTKKRKEEAPEFDQISASESIGEGRLVMENERLKQRLKELEGQGLVSRKVISDRPIAVSYEITDFGCTALDLLEKLNDWPEENGI